MLYDEFMQNIYYIGFDMMKLETNLCLFYICYFINLYSYQIFNVYVKIYKWNFCNFIMTTYHLFYINNSVPRIIKIFRKKRNKFEYNLFCAKFPKEFEKRITSTVIYYLFYSKTQKLINLQLQHSAKTFPFVNFPI